MKINIETKYNIGQYLYIFEKSLLKNDLYQGYIYKVQITAIYLIDENGNYFYGTYKGVSFENQLFEKLKDLKQYLKDNGYTNIKYVG